MPEIVLPFTVRRVSTWFVAPGSIGVTVNPNDPVTLPFRLPMKLKVPRFRRLIGGGARGRAR